MTGESEKKEMMFTMLDCPGIQYTMNVIKDNIFNYLYAMFSCS